MEKITKKENDTDANSSDAISEDEEYEDEILYTVKYPEKMTAQKMFSKCVNKIIYGKPFSDHKRILEAQKKCRYLSRGGRTKKKKHHKNITYRHRRKKTKTKSKGLIL